MILRLKQGSRKQQDWQQPKRGQERREVQEESIFLLFEMGRQTRKEIPIDLRPVALSEDFDFSQRREWSRVSDPKRFLARTWRPVSCLGFGGIQHLRITCALKSTGVAHSQQASLRQDIAPYLGDDRARRLDDFGRGGLSIWRDAGLKLAQDFVEGLAIAPNRPQSSSSADFRTGKMNPDLLTFPSSLVGGRSRPHYLSTDSFSSPIPFWGDVPEADSEAVPLAPLRQHRSCFFDDGPRSEIREGDLADTQRKYAIHPSVGMRSPSEFERAPDGGAN
ncbi:hypothetical protein F2Q69_00006636 [Brassica cretica]|uniref:Uncharacterized protein n=1 Tax=Brassica cretica TaxID=69181 RepID=A0A8S9P364_BRACR|nr:hypothetical protein F2Q69_00006636 [Brassica cretica]